MFRLDTLAALAALLTNASAFPWLLAERANLAGLLPADAEVPVEKRQVFPIISYFNASEQYVSNQGKYKFVPPGPGDQRGPCPGLNAMANHGYLPHNGVASIEQFIQANYEVFGMGDDLAGFLAVYGSVFNGDLHSWSIGGPSPAVQVLSGYLGTPQGMSGSHNKYENDASPMRGDLYVQGNDYLTQIPNFESFYNKQKGVPDDQVNYGLDIITAFRAQRFDHSIAHNPYFFNGPFSGVIASPAAYSFIFRFMGNKSEQYPEGRLDRNVLKSFYAIEGEPGSFSYKAGWERIPDNWYKRAIGDEYTIPFLAQDAFHQNLAHNEFVSVGGNLGKTNSFTGEDPSDLTGGVYNLQNLFQGNNAMCFGFELLIQAAPDLLEGIYTDVTPAMDKLSGAFKKASAKLGGCPQIEKKTYGQYKKYPGFSKSYDGYKGQKS